MSQLTGKGKSAFRNAKPIRLTVDRATGVRESIMPQFSAESGSSEQAEPSGFLFTSQMLNQAILRVSALTEGIEVDCDFDTKIVDLGIDSMQLVELIIELEEIVGTQLELRVIDQLETLGDVCRALSPIGELS
jgi:acyl carrier protein